LNRKLYPELKSRKFIEPDIIDDGEKLSRIEDASQDFIIANHFLEHCEDPIGTVGAFA
jgi:predicted SAM-dependent methyltransferase